MDRRSAWTFVFMLAVCCVGAQEDDAPCECVPYYLCMDGNVITDGTDLVDIRSGLSNRAGVPACSDPVAKCCSVPPEARNLTTTTTTTTELPPIDPHTPAPPVTTTVVPEIPTNVITPLVGCGVRRELPTSQRIISGVSTGATHYAEFPWMMMLLTQERLNGSTHFKFKCGGSLVHPLVVVTAAHCVVGVDQSTLTVRGGEWDTQSTAEPLPHQDRAVSQIIVHPQYNPRNLQNDIAVIIVDRAYNMTDNVDIICPPTQSENFDDDRCVASGWGKDSFREGSYQQVLRKVDLRVVPDEECQQRLRNTRLGKFFLLHESFVCAGGEPGKDTCAGDGGSPLVCPLPRDPKRWTQVGIVSWGIGCGEANPAVYTKFSHYVNWIIAQVPREFSADDGI